MAKVVAILIIALCSLIILGSCGQAGPVMTASPQTPTPSATPPPLATTVSSDHNFLPGEVLADLPVYPGATPTTFFNSGTGPPSYPLSEPAYASTLRPGYQSASAQFTVQATDENILSWYVNELGTEGYRNSFEERFGGGTISGQAITFFLPSQPLVSVEVHVYDVPGTPVFELLVTYTVPLPKPPEEELPDDIDSIAMTYFSGNLTTVKTITDSQAVTQLVSMVNALPVRPDYVSSCGFGGPQTIFRLVFHSQSKGDITVSDIIGCGVTGIHIDNYPILEDTHGLLQEAVEQILGIQSTNNGSGGNCTANNGSGADYASLIDNLRKAGAVVEPQGEASPDFLSAKRMVMTVNGSNVTVWEYDDAAAADAEAALISPDGSSLRTDTKITLVDWIAPPHFYKAGKLIVLYVGESEDVIAVLECLLGPQFAGQ
jgi:hypothetical protein